MNDEQLKREFAFDQYGRYAVIRDIINRNRKNNEKFRVLDVGGRGNILKKFLPDDDVFYLDPLIDSDDNNFIEGDGCAIPLKDENFDWVTSADVFEHILPEKRNDFLRENVRVAKLGTILVAPFWSKEVEQAEINANENYKILTGGEDHIWLKEHIENGLPKEAVVEDFIKLKKIQFEKIENNRLFLWEILIGLSFIVSRNYSEKIKKEFENFNYFYNSKVFPFDFSNPSYRKVYLIKKYEFLKGLDTFKRSIDDPLFLETIKCATNLLGNIDLESKKNIQQKIQEIQVKNQELQQKEIVIQKQDQELQQKEIVIQKQDQELQQKEIVIQQKDQMINFITSSKFWKLRNRYIKLKSFNLDYFITLAKKAFGVYKQYGILIFLKYFYKYILHGREYFQQKNSIISDYQRWIQKNENWNIEEIRKEIKSLTYKPKISIITPVYNVDPKWLDKCIESVRNQFYENWELCLHNDASTKKETIDCLKKWGKADKRIKISFGKENQHISGASNEALKLATGEFIALLDNDDELSPNALYENVKVLNNHPEADFIYSDEDKLEMDETRSDPFFKPSWSLDLFLSMNYTCHLGIYRKKIIDEIGGFRKGYEGSQDYDLILRFIEKTKPKNIFHISKILYHWRKIPGSTADKFDYKNYANDAAKKALAEYLERNNIKGKVLDGVAPGLYRIKRELIGNPKVSIIIPFKDQAEILERCVDSIVRKTVYKNYEIILVNNQSKEKDTFEYLDKIKTKKNIKILNYDKPFNFSAINNFAVKNARGEFILFLNNDMEVISDSWLCNMIEHIQRKEVGAVGAKLFYPNDTIQHAGVVMGLGIAGHPFKHLPSDTPGNFGLVASIRNYCAVTGACLLTKKELFEKIGGFDEKNLPVAYNDVDLCLRIVENGNNIVYTPYAELYHYESLSRGSDNEDELKFKNPEKYARVISERRYMDERWKKYIDDDPYYSPNLTRTREDFSFRLE